MKISKTIILFAISLLSFTSCYDNPPYPSIEDTTWFGTNEGCGRYIEVTFHQDGTCDAIFYISDDSNVKPSPINSSSSGYITVAKGNGLSYKPFDGYYTKSTLTLSYIDGIPEATEGPLVDFPTTIDLSMSYDNHRFFINVTGNYSYPVDMSR